MDFSPFFPSQNSSLEPVMKPLRTKKNENERGLEVNSVSSTSPPASGWYAQVKESVKLMKSSEHEKGFKAAAPHIFTWDAQPMTMTKTSEDEKRLEATSSSDSHSSSSFHYAPVAAVCVGKDENSKNALNWALNHLASEGDIIQILHVWNPIRYSTRGHLAIDSVVGSEEYRKQRESRISETLLPYQYMCDIRKVRSEIIVLDEVNVPHAIVKHISKAYIRKIVLGASSRNRISRIMKAPDIPTRVARIAPKFCRVYVISKRQQISFQSGAFVDPKSNVYDSQRNSSFGLVSDFSRSGPLHIQNQPRRRKSKNKIAKCADQASIRRITENDGSQNPKRSVEVEGWQGSRFLAESPRKENQGLSFSNPTMDPIAMEKGFSEVEPDKENMMKSSNVKSQVSIASIETELSRSGSFNGKTEANYPKRRLGEILKLSTNTEFSNPYNQSFIATENKSPQNHFLCSESYHGISDPETQLSEIDEKENTFPLQSKFVRNASDTRLREFRSLIPDVSEDYQSLGESNLEGKKYSKDSIELQVSPARHSDFSFSAGRSAKENEALFEICSPDIKPGSLWKTSKAEMFKTVKGLEDPIDISNFRSRTKSLTLDNESFRLPNDLSLPDHFSSPDLFHDNQNSEEIDLNLEEREPSEETLFLRHARRTKIADPSFLVLQVAQGFNKNFQFPGSPNAKDNHNYKKGVEIRPRPEEHLRVSTPAETSSDENEDFFEIPLSDFEAATPQIASNEEKLSNASKTPQSDTPSVDTGVIELDETFSLQKIHLDPSSPGFIEDIGSEVENLKIQIQRILEMYNDEVKTKWKQL